MWSPGLAAQTPGSTSRGTVCLSVYASRRVVNPGSSRASDGLYLEPRRRPISPALKALSLKGLCFSSEAACVTIRPPPRTSNVIEKVGCGVTLEAHPRDASDFWDGLLVSLHDDSPLASGPPLLALLVARGQWSMRLVHRESACGRDNVHREEHPHFFVQGVLYEHLRR